MTKTVCVHGISLSQDCGPCAESYGNARPTEELRSAEIKTNNLRWNNTTGRLEQQHVGNGGTGPYVWRDVPFVDVPAITAGQSDA